MATHLRYPGKVVIVTGGTAGIGLGIVKEFVHQGANVVFCSKPSEVKVGQAIQKELQDSGCPGDAYFQVCDVRKEADIKRLILVTVERYGCLDCLVNNVGIGYAEKIDDVTVQEIWNIMDVNLVSVFLASKYALPYLRETRGNIINISGSDAVFGLNNVVMHSTTKGGVIPMSKTLAIDESKYGVRVNCLSVGHIWTPFYEKYVKQFSDPEAMIEAAKKMQLVGRLGTPEEVALAVLFLAADGTFCTGLNLVLNGGAEVGFGKKSLVEPLYPYCASGNSSDSSSKQ